MKSVTLWVALTVVALTYVDKVLSGLGHSGFLAGLVRSMIK